MKSKIFFIIAFIIGYSQFSLATVDGKRQFDRNEIERYRNQDKYDYDKAIVAYKPSPFINFILNFFAFFAQGIGLFILILIGLALLFLIFYFISKSNYSKTIDDTEIEDVVIQDLEDIESLDLDLLLKEAIISNNFRLAIRIHYLKILKGLNEKKIIEWKNEKTNYDYIQEIKDQNLKSDLDRVTYLYEYVWYGEVELTKSKFVLIEPEFNVLGKKVMKG